MKTIHRKHCRTCLLGEPDMKYGIDKRGKVWVQAYICRTCNSKYHKRFLKTKSGRVAANKNARKSYLKYPEKQYARVKVHVAVKKGIIAKPSYCESCGKNKPLEGHHINYSKPLDVVWLCTVCHHKLHKSVLK